MTVDLDRLDRPLSSIFSEALNKDNKVRFLSLGEINWIFCSLTSLSSSNMTTATLLHWVDSIQ